MKMNFAVKKHRVAINLFVIGPSVNTIKDYIAAKLDNIICLNIYNENVRRCCCLSCMFI